MRRTAVEEEAPMLEMTPVVAPGEDAKDEEAGEPGAPGTQTPTPEEGLAGEFAVGAGVPRTWDDPHEGCPDDCGPDGPVSLRRRIVATLCLCLGARRLGYMAVLVEERQGQAGADARRRRSQDETFMYRWAVLALHLLCDVPLIAVSGAIGIAVLPDRLGDENSLGFISVVSGHGVILRRVPGSWDWGRHPEKPEPNWRWNDQARTFRPPGACYVEFGLVVESRSRVARGRGRALIRGTWAPSTAWPACVCIVLDVIVMRVCLRWSFLRAHPRRGARGRMASPARARSVARACSSCAQ